MSDILLSHADLDNHISLTRDRSIFNIMISSSGYGHVTTISSVAGLFGSIKLVDYSCSKFAVMGLVEALRFEIMAEVCEFYFFLETPTVKIFGFRLSDLFLFFYRSENICIIHFYFN